MKKTNIVIVDGQKVEFNEPKVTGNQILVKACKTPVECYTLYIKKPGCDFEKVSLDEVVDISDGKVEHFVTKEPEVFNYTLDGEPEMTDQKTLTAVEILRLAGIDPQNKYLVLIHTDGTKENFAFNPDEPIKMVCPKMTFVTSEWVDKVVIEAYGKECKEVPPAHVNVIKVDKTNHDWKGRFIKGEQIISLSGKQPAYKFTALKFMNNQQKPVKVELNEKVDLYERCLIRFVVQPKTQDDGDEPRRQFKLPPPDIQFLDTLGLRWETVVNGNYWLIIHDYPIPEGYNVRKADVALMIPAQYDAVQIDMASFCPALGKTNGRGINAVSETRIDGRSFQQWSRHRKPNEWVPGVDSISTHLFLVDNWLANDLKR